LAREGREKHANVANSYREKEKTMKEWPNLHMELAIAR